MEPRVKRIIEIAEKCFADTLSVRTLSSSVNLSPPRLRQLFKEETGLPPMQYIKRLRMKRAAKLLQESFFSVKEIVFMSGSTDVSHFVRDFKKQYGATPSEFRARSQASRMSG